MACLAALDDFKAPRVLAACILALQLAAYAYVFWNWRFSDLQQRLKAYSEMHSRSKESDCTRGLLLSAAEHRILLGTTKRVEAKNATLATFIAFFGAALVALYAASENANLTNLTKEYLVSLLLGLLSPLLASITGNHHLDQVYFSVEVNTQKHQAIERRMQVDLMEDLVFKENRYRFAYFSVQPLIFAAFLYLLVLTWYPNLLLGS